MSEYIIDNTKTKEELFSFVMWLFEQGDNLPEEYNNYKIDILFKPNIYIVHEPVETYYKFDMFYATIKTLGIANVEFIGIVTDTFCNDGKWVNYVYTDDNSITQTSWDRFYSEPTNFGFNYFEKKFIKETTIWLNFIDEDDFNVEVKSVAVQGDF